MKFLLLVPLLLLLIVNPAFAFLSEDGTGLIKRFDVNVDGHIFEVITTSNYDIEEHEFNKDEKRLTFFVNSSLENNLGEMVLPNELLGDNLTFYVNDVKSIQNVKSSEKISFITLNFTGIGNNKIDIIGTEIAETFDSQGGGCLIATATFDSEMSEQVQQLRELRDNSLLQTEYGTVFVKSFNQFYYSFSPFIADYERENVLFKEAIKITITPMLLSLSVLNYVDIDSEQTVLGYGIGIISLNAMMYLGLPILGIVSLRRLF
ncbi:MAG TPA: CFI-box-CTERM domain-containing protein [Nitrosopumilus sp.]|nr:CFI-box-CTERM domain-containing protein [Nitrosopumilus sp.]